MIDILLSAIALTLAYLLGSIPSGLLLTRWAGLGDIRAVGSGNIGATNVLRAAGKKWGAITLALDIAKGIAAVLLAYAITGSPSLARYAMLAAMIGHCYPVWLGFKGGKGVAVAIGVVIAFYHLIWAEPVYSVFLPLAAIWVITMYLSRYVSLASIITAIMLPIITLTFTGMGIVEILMTALILYKHWDNILRLQNGTEHRFQFGR